MDNTKIFIDIDDEITFVSDRILHAGTENVILVIPERASILSSLPSLKLLAYVLERTHKKVVIVTMDDLGQILASRAGFITRGRVGEVTPDVWSEFKKPDIEEEISLDEKDIEDVVLPEEVVTPEEIVEPIQEPVEEEIVEPIIETKPEEAIEESAPVVESKLDEMKDMNPTIYELEKVAPEEDKKIEPKEEAKPKFVESVKIVKLNGFNLYIGGDAAVFKKSREVTRSVVEHSADKIDYLRGSGNHGIIGNDMEAALPKKKD